MKECLACKTAYSDETLRFCLLDGTSLSTVREGEDTIAIRRGNDETAVLSRGDGAFRQPSHAGPPTQLHRTTQPSESTASSLKTLFAIIVIGVVILGVLVVFGVILYLNAGRLDIATNSSPPSPTTSKSTSGDDSVPPNAVVEDLVKDSTAQFTEAVSSGDFSDLYNDASTDFQDTYTVDQVKTAFMAYTDKRTFVVPILRKVSSATASFSPRPSIRTEKGLSILVASGTFPTKPVETRFDYEYVYRSGKWKLLKLVINLP